ncbi:MAG: hypothetical protein CVV02_00325 [Firmicutes bacterium HGW-Firmicutes-7]|nr:MAG: hypothetical protein CVV02_00325 [Firmicutes bacterium HGW-Firmicutes-7]
MEWYYILLIILGVVAIALGVLYFLGKKMQTKVNDQQSLIDQSKMTTSILVIDKKKMKISESNLPKMIQEQVPFYLKFRKVPLVKAKIGPKITTLMCDEKIFKNIPVKKQIKVEIAGLYIVAIKGGTSATAKAPATTKATTKKDAKAVKVPKTPKAPKATKATKEAKATK